MTSIRIYEPALCCESGVCGPDSDASLVTVTADVRRLKDLGADIERHNLATDPTAFTDDVGVRAFMHTVGSKGLPLTVVDGVTVATGRYLDREQLLDFAGLAASLQPESGRVDLGLTSATAAPASADASGCCGGPAGCC
ncbi:arsenite efflux transporter metallochaperone ArsD [Cryobacterium sp. CG_9.6]|uniref:arsenite efflux transporter metallochaperone ArsD n=1 Tax=Cryobacterium sp. CG_9.6 TaxID=2760710 RepID=UPI0024751907|nr:arsenite efflux transporter metallochaperone ArsD [Cryobacterium sp. CG_9.6]MDH6236692.1 arsenite-transporting ATPase [Cryobacterium sp. CG_9.6]